MLALNSLRSVNQKTNMRIRLVSWQITAFDPILYKSRTTKLSWEAVLAYIGMKAYISKQNA